MILLLLLFVLAAVAVADSTGSKPNFLVINLDDLGYGDISAYSSRLSTAPNIKKLGRTPQIDRMASEGLLFTDFYAASCVCSPSRAGLLTGRYPFRTTIFPRVLTPESFDGLPQSEITIAKHLRDLDPSYYTFAVGKWHLGHVEPFLPTNHGFQHWTGIPYSHDFCPCPTELTNTGDNACRDFLPPCPLMNGSNIWQQPAQLQALTEYYARATIERMREAQALERPFFAYYACQHTHYPQFFNNRFRGASRALGGRDDALGDALVEMDSAIGMLLEHLRDSGAMNNTYVFLTSDNGAAHAYANNAGSNEPLRCGKGTTWEGGVRVPLIVWGARTRVNQTTSELVAGMDIFPTIAALARLGPPNSSKRVLDGVDFSPVLMDAAAQSERKDFIYYALEQGGTADAVRLGKYKVHFRTSVWMDVNLKSYRRVESCHPPGVDVGTQQTPLVYNLELDAEERFPLKPQEEETRAIVAKARSLLALDTCAIVTGKRSSLAAQIAALERAPGCELSRQMNCLSGELNPMPWPPALSNRAARTSMLEQPWRQPALQCCAHDEDVVLLPPGLVGASKFTCKKRARGGGDGEPTPPLSCDKASNIIPCNPSAVLFPQCAGRAVCQSGNEFYCSNSSKSSVGACPDTLAYCAKGLVQCQINNQCVKSVSDCPKSKIAFSSRMCGQCRESDLIDYNEVSVEGGSGGETLLVAPGEQQDDATMAPTIKGTRAKSASSLTPTSAPVVVEEKKASHTRNEVLLVVLVGMGSLFALLVIALVLMQCKHFLFNYCGWNADHRVDVESRANLGEDAMQLIAE